jgi:hypothetical protein
VSGRWLARVLGGVVVRRFGYLVLAHTGLAWGAFALLVGCVVGRVAFGGRGRRARAGRRGRPCGWRPSRAEYREGYLHGGHWREFRSRWWVAHPDARCEACGCGHPLDLHHVRYGNLGHEGMGDVVALCRQDHDAVHGQGAPVSRRAGYVLSSLRARYPGAWRGE